MRILKTVQAYFPFREMGGPVVKVRALARELAESGHKVTVLTADLGLAKTQFSSRYISRAFAVGLACRGALRGGDIPSTRRFRAVSY